MSKLPRLSGRDCIKALAKVGFYPKRQHGSHVVVRRDNPFAQLVVPDHNELDRDVKSVHRDIHALIEIGLVTKDSKGSVLVPFSRIRTEFDLQPKQAA